MKPITKEEAIRLLQHMIRIDTCNPPGNELMLASFLKEYAERHGLAVQISSITDGRSNVRIMLKGDGMGNKRLMFCGHLDTVRAWPDDRGRYSPHGGVHENGRVYGRGASDMKSGLAAMLLAMIAIKSEIKAPCGDLILAATAGEEVDCRGAFHYMEHVGIEENTAIVIGEPTNGKIAVGHKGALWLKLTVTGKSAHASMPKLGVNAVEKMIGVIEAFRKMYQHQLLLSDPILGASSIAVTCIEGGIQTNIIPDRCSAEIDIRTVPPIAHTELLKLIDRTIQELQEQDPALVANVEILLDRRPIVTKSEHPLIRAAMEISEVSPTDIVGMSYYTDASVLNHNGRLPVLLYGPGNEDLAHQVDEYVEVERYMKAISFYKKLAERYLTE